jgi:NADH:ubiquinone oxidoreductase subunit E
MELSVTDNNGTPKVLVNVCLGTGCYLRGAQDLIHNLIKATEKSGLIDKIDVRGSFCFEFCDRGPVVKIGGEIIEAATVEKVLSKINQLVSVSKEAVTV